MARGVLQRRLRVSLVDRLIHNSEIVSVDGEFYRLKEAYGPFYEFYVRAAITGISLPAWRFVGRRNQIAARGRCGLTVPFGWDQSAAVVPILAGLGNAFD